MDAVKVKVATCKHLKPNGAKNNKKSKQSSKKSPAEAIASMKEGFRNCLRMGSDCLMAKDFMNAQMFYGSIIADLENTQFILDLNELEVFSLHCCFAYCCIGAADSCSDDVLLPLTHVQGSIQCPMVNYLRAYVYALQDKFTAAIDQIEESKKLLEQGYNFKSNSVLNEDVIAEINPVFLKLKLNGLSFACNLLKSKSNTDFRQNFKSTWMKIGELCDIDTVEKSKEEGKKSASSTPPEVVDRASSTTTQPLTTTTTVQVQTEKSSATPTNGKPSTANNNKKPEKSKVKTANAMVQTVSKKFVSVAVQTMPLQDKNPANKELMGAVVEIKNKLQTLQNRKDDENKRLQKVIQELNEKLVNKDRKITEMQVIKQQNAAMEKKLEKGQEDLRYLTVMIVSYIKDKYEQQRRLLQLYESRCVDKIEYFREIHRYLHPNSGMSREECKDNEIRWMNLLSMMADNKRALEDFQTRLADLAFEGNLSSLKMSEWPHLPDVPPDKMDPIYRCFRAFLMHNNNGSSSPRTGPPPKFSNPPPKLSNPPPKLSNPPQNAVSNPPLPEHLRYQNRGGPVGENPPSKNPFLLASFDSPPGEPSPSGSEKHPVAAPPGFLNLPERGHHQQAPQMNTANTNPQPRQKHLIQLDPEKDFFRTLKITFTDVDEADLRRVVYMVRDQNGGTIEGLSKDQFISRIKNCLKKQSAAKGWTALKTSPPIWTNDHTENKCCICFDEYNSATSHTLPCQHEFHGKCIKDWLKQQSACPVCRIHTVIDEDYPPLGV